MMFRKGKLWDSGVLWGNTTVSGHVPLKLHSWLRFSICISSSRRTCRHNKIRRLIFHLGFSFPFRLFLSSSCICSVIVWPYESNNGLELSVGIITQTPVQNNIIQLNVKSFIKAVFLAGQIVLQCSKLHIVYHDSASTFCMSKINGLCVITEVLYCSCGSHLYWTFRHADNLLKN